MRLMENKDFATYFGVTDLEDKSFEPCVIESRDYGLPVTEMILSDEPIIWKPYGSYSKIALGYSFTGDLIGVRILDAVKQRRHV